MRFRGDRIVCPEGVVSGEVVVAGGRITSVGPASSERGDLVELGNRWLVPGYIDMHVHGGAGAQCNTAEPDEVATLARFHAHHGTTGLLATTVPAPAGELRRSLEAIADSGAPNLLGAHLEGPFLNRERPGALDPGLFQDPDLDQLEQLLAAGAGTVRVMTVAPELPRGLELVERLVNAGIVASIGHTAARDEQIREAVRAGATAATHLFNGMTPFHHRDPGVVGAVLDLEEVSCELICDGLHVDPVAMRLVCRAKGASGIRLVTDATAAAGMPDGEYLLGDRPLTVKDGRPRVTGGGSIAGSTLTMEVAFQNAVSLLGVPIEDAVLIASTNSARLLGLQERKGAIAEGFDADLVVLGEQLSVEATMIAGRWATTPP